jgi:hypothetical protein
VNPLSWLSPTRWLLCAGLLLALWAGYEAWADHQQDIGDQRATARYELALAKQRTEAATKLATVTAAVRAKERNTRQPWRPMRAVLLLLSACMLASCATRTPPPNVGAVVVAPAVQIPPVPTIVQMTQPKPAGYFQQQLLDYSSGSSEKPTKSTTPTPAAGPTPSN